MKDLVILKTYCKYIMRVGSGNFWYEEEEIGDDNNLYYRIYRSLLFATYIIVTILEIMAVLIGDFPPDEIRDAVTFSVCHTVVLLKFYCVISNKKLIRSMNKNMVALCAAHEEENLMTEKYRVLKICNIAFFIIVYGAVAGFIFEGLTKVKDGSRFATIITYYPGHDDNSALAISFRIFTTTVVTVMVTTMVITVDSFTVAYLIVFKYKFITLRRYFESLREKYIKMSKNGNSRAAADHLTSAFVDGIIMHQDLLSMANNIDTAFGMVMALQLCQSSGSAVSLLLQMALSDQLTFVAGMKIIFFVTALFFLLGLFLCNVGEITYQASLLSDAMFFCGWEEYPQQPPPQRSLRCLVLLACAQAQQPIVMKAFKMVPLSYDTFLQVLRGTYSVFALFYARNK